MADIVVAWHKLAISLGIGLYVIYTASDQWPPVYISLRDLNLTI